jgi:hypothetical protein
MTPISAPERILQQFGVTEPREIDLEAIAWTLGAEVRYRPLDGCEARIVGNGDRAIITVNTRSSARRQRFSLGHEIGHWCHHRGRCLVCRADDISPGSEGRNALEKTADRYAANLLLPPYLLRPYLAKQKRLTFKAISDIANVFDSSLTATAIQIVESRMIPAILVCHGTNGRRWFCRSGDVATIWFPQDQLDSESFAFDVLFGNKPDDLFPRKIGADAWFDRRGADKYELHEQSMRTNNDEVLTLLLIEE